MNYLVTGGAGFIGSHVAEKLVSKGHSVYVLDNFHTGSMDNLRHIESVNVMKGNVMDYLGRKNDRFFDGVFHFGIPSSTPMYRENPMLMGQTINEFIHLIRHTDCKIVFSSSSSVYNGCDPPHHESMMITPTDYYTETRIAMERLAKLYEVLENREIVALRFFSIYGDHEESKGRYANMVTQILWDMLKRQPPVLYGDGRQTRDFIWIGDVVNATLQAMELLPADVYNVGTGKSYSFNEVVSLINKALGTSIKPRYIENPLANYVKDTRASIQKIQSALKRPLAMTPFEEGLKHIIAYYKRPHV